MRKAAMRTQIHKVARVLWELRAMTKWFRSTMLPASSNPVGGLVKGQVSKKVPSRGLGEYKPVSRGGLGRLCEHGSQIATALTIVMAVGAALWAEPHEVGRSSLGGTRGFA